MIKTVELYKPYAHQKALHDAITKHIESNERFTDSFQRIFVVKACRQVGKSAMAENELSRFLLQYSNSINAYVSPTLKLARKTYEEVIKMFKDTGLILRKNSIELFIEFTNGSCIRFFSGEQRDNLRGFTISGLLVIDEAAFIRDDIYNECLSPWTDAKKAVTLIISTPKFKLGFFYDYYIMGWTGKHTVTSIDFMDYDLTHIRSKEKLEEKRLTVPTQVFKSEYMGLFLEAEGAVFGDFSGCIMQDTPEFEQLYLGLDFGTGSGQDYTVLTALNEKCEQVFIWRTNELSPTEQVNAIAKILTENKKSIANIVAEENGIGKVYLDLLRKNFTPITTFTTDNNSKRKLVEKLQVAFQNKTIRLLKDTIQTNELSLYESSVNPKTNKVSYNAPNGMHDDSVMALMLALESFNKKRNSTFRVSFI